MTDIIAILYLLLCLYGSNPVAPDPALAQSVFTEYQFHGYEAAVEKIQEYAFLDLNRAVDLEQAENLDQADASKNAPSADKPAIDPAKLDYKKELANLGFYREESRDSKLNLRNAVLRFESSCNLTVNGNWDSNCLKSLVSILSEKQPRRDIVASPPSEGMWIAVNKSKRILTLYKGIIVLKKYPVAIGNPSSLTPEGKFTIVSKVIDPDWGGGGYAKPVKGGLPSNPLGHRWLGLSYKTGDDLGIHGNNSPYSIGKNISHGCIRMINSDVEELFEIIPKSSNVWIGSEATLKSWGIEQQNIAS